jgi:hypothetical protein
MIAVCFVAASVFQLLLSSFRVSLSILPYLQEVAEIDFPFPDIASNGGTGQTSLVNETSVKTNSKFANLTTNNEQLWQSRPFDTRRDIVLVAGLPKSGTTSMHKYFRCGGVRSVHTHSRNSKKEFVRIGQCIEENVMADRPPLQNCGKATVWTDNGYAGPLRQQPGKCFYPSLHGLEAFHQHYNESLVILLNVRSRTSWAKRIVSWNNLAERWKHCSSRPLMPRSTTVEYLETWYDRHNEHVRRFARNHSDSIRFVEVQLENFNTGRVLTNHFGIPASCWKRCLPGSSCSDLNQTSVSLAVKDV